MSGELVKQKLYSKFWQASCTIYLWKYCYKGKDLSLDVQSKKSTVYLLGPDNQPITIKNCGTIKIKTKTHNEKYCNQI